MEKKRKKENKSSATIRDVAKHAEVSIGTVSRYLNGYVLKEKNRKKIEVAIEELNYKENIIAKGLKNNHTMTVGVVIDHLTDIFMTSVVSHIESFFEKQGYSIMLCDYHGAEEILERKLEFLRNRYIEGLILFPYMDCSRLLIPFQEAGIPIVLVNDAIENCRTDKIVVDNRQSSKQAVIYLLERGHKHIGIIGGRLDSYTSDERIAGYKEAMGKANQVILPTMVVMGDFNEQGGYIATKQLLKNHPEITAIFCCSYAMSIGMLLAIDEAGKSIGRDISVVSFDNFEMFRLLKPAITVIEQPLDLMGYQAANILFKRIKGDMGDFPKLITCKTSLIMRNSISDLRM